MALIDLQQEENQRILKKYNKQMTTGRVVIYLLMAVVLTAGIVASLKFAMYADLVLVVITGTVFLGLVALSYKKPFISFVIISILSFLFFLLVFYDAITNAGIIPESPILIPQLLVASIMVRAAMSARKYEVLKKELNT